jgi:hypothetical protein
MVTASSDDDALIFISYLRRSPEKSTAFPPKIPRQFFPYPHLDRCGTGLRDRILPTQSAPGVELAEAEGQIVFSGSTRYRTPRVQAQVPNPLLLRQRKAHDREFGRRVGRFVKQRYMLSVMCGRSTYN